MGDSDMTDKHWDELLQSMDEMAKNPPQVKGPLAPPTPWLPAPRHLPPAEDWLMENPKDDPRFEVFKGYLETNLQQWNPKLVKSLQAKGQYHEFVNQRVENAISQLLHAEAKNLPIDQEEVEREMYTPAEETREEQELARAKA